ncbi:MAG: hypothetical protein JWO53_690 [Chlamydiia bacterium]|nr:hypothetical protein [Chlamydiia bacterium]
MITIRNNIINIYGESHELYQNFMANSLDSSYQYQRQEETLTSRIEKAIVDIKAEIGKNGIHQKSKYIQSMETLLCYMETLEFDWQSLKSTIKAIEPNRDPFFDIIASFAKKIMATVYRVNKAIFFITESTSILSLDHHYACALKKLFSRSETGAAIQFIAQITEVKTNEDHDKVRKLSNTTQLIYKKWGVDTSLDYMKRAYPASVRDMLLSSFLFNLCLKCRDQDTRVVLAHIKSYMSGNPMHSSTLAKLATKVVNENPKFAIHIAALIPCQKTAIEWFTENRIFQSLMNCLEKEDINGMKEEIENALEYCADTPHNAKELISYAIENLIVPKLPLQKARILASLIPNELIRKAAEAELSTQAELTEQLHQENTAALNNVTLTSVPPSEGLCCMQ